MFSAEYLNYFCHFAVYSNKSKFPSNRLKAPSFPEFEQLYWQEFKLRQQRLKQDKKLMVSTILAELIVNEAYLYVGVNLVSILPA